MNSSAADLSPTFLHVELQRPEHLVAAVAGLSGEAGNCVSLNGERVEHSGRSRLGGEHLALAVRLPFAGELLEGWLMARVVLEDKADFHTGLGSSGQKDVLKHRVGRETSMLAPKICIIWRIVAANRRPVKDAYVRTNSVHLFVAELDVDDEIRQSTSDALDANAARSDDAVGGVLNQREDCLK